MDHRTPDGAFVRMLMTNQGRSAPTRKQEVRSALKIGSRDFPALIRSSQDRLSMLGLELVGIDGSDVVGPVSADRYFLRRQRTHDDVSELLTQELRRLILTFAFIILEQLCVDTTRLWFLLGRSGVFNNEDEFSDFLGRSRKQGYLTVTRRDESLVVGLGWRYRCDFGGFDPREYFGAHGAKESGENIVPQNGGS